MPNVLEAKDLRANRVQKNSLIKTRLPGQLRLIDRRQLLLEFLEPCQFPIQRSFAQVCRSPVILVQAQLDRSARAKGEKAIQKLTRNPVEIMIVRSAGNEGREEEE